MSKPEEKAKTDNQNTVQVVAEFTVRAYSNGTVNINGPIDNFFLFRSVMNSAEKAVLEHVAKKLTEPKSGIVVPGMAMPQGIVGRN